MLARLEMMIYHALEDGSDILCHDMQTKSYDFSCNRFYIFILDDYVSIGRLFDGYVSTGILYGYVISCIGSPCWLG